MDHVNTISASDGFNFLIGALICGFVIFILVRLMNSESKKDEYKANNSFKPLPGNQKHYHSDTSSKVDRIVINGKKFGEDESVSILNAIKNGNKVEAIWQIRSMPGISLKNAKDFVEKTGKNLAVSHKPKDNLSVANTSAATNSKVVDNKGKAEEIKLIKSEISNAQFSSFLSALENDNKIAAIKILRESAGLGPLRAKELIDSLLEKVKLENVTKNVLESSLKQIIKQLKGENVEVVNVLKPKSSPTNLSKSESEFINTALENGNKIDAIRLFSDATGLGWNEANSYIQKIDEKRKLESKKKDSKGLSNQNGIIVESENHHHFSNSKEPELLAPDKGKTESAAILNAIENGSKIESIKLFRDATGVGLLEAKESVENIESKIKKASNKQEALEQIQSQLANEINKGKGADHKQITIKSANIDLGDVETKSIMSALHKGNKIEAIKLLRQYKGLDLKVAKEIIDSLEAQYK